ncbi:hypothetical protein AQUCO_00900025v1 [Aquilegia coerulea]|uniref:Uncharacterized protein n=1 Tax=Aquilegia coerulea TaxID=218851 RepID=A0A2G5EBI1_AQUCA|nr:hypothetical protein AQUCO_00900025v1 [Aquilegia coerulea]
MVDLDCESETEGFNDKLKITTEENIKEMEMEMDMDMDLDHNQTTTTTVVDLLERFLGVQQRRAEAYANLRRGFIEYMVSGGESAYQQLCAEITQEFNACSNQVLELESFFLKPDFSRNDLASLLRSVQTHEKEKLHLVLPLTVLNMNALFFFLSFSFCVSVCVYCYDRSYYATIQ